jgi:hypothetical protein
MRQIIRHISVLTGAMLLTVWSLQAATLSRKVDVLIIGGGASGTAAGIQAARMGVRTLIVEETPWLGGMLTAAGVSAIDGNYALPSGLFGEFRDSLAVHYGGLAHLKTGWVSNVLFEPSVAKRILQNIAKNESQLTVWLQTKFVSLRKVSSGWKVTVFRKGQPEEITAKILIDATELGDIAKACGVKYDVGMDARAYSGESIAPEKPNNIVQDLTYVAILKDYGKGADKTIPKPAGYDPSLFYCTCKSVHCSQPKEAKRLLNCDSVLTYGKLPNDKYMINWPIEGNDCYLNVIEMSPQQRLQALKKAKETTLNFVYYLQTELGYKNLGLADDEYPTADKLAMIPYYRESRRIHGQVRFNLNHVADPYGQKEKLYRTGIAVGDYPVDHHHTKYPDWQKLPDLHFYPVPSYNLPLGVMIPQGVRGVIVAEKSISVSNLVNGTTRLQPVVMQIGQAAGVVAALAVKQRKEVADVSVREVQNQLLAAKGYIMPYLDVLPTDPFFLPLQRIGATGILKGIGRHVNWNNQTWIRANDILEYTDLKGLKAVYPKVDFNDNDSVACSVDVLLAVIRKIAFVEKIALPSDLKIAAINLLKQSNISDTLLNRPIFRKEAAVLIDRFLDPFNRKAINIKGDFVSEKR